MGKIYSGCERIKFVTWGSPVDGFQKVTVNHSNIYLLSDGSAYSLCL